MDFTEINADLYNARYLDNRVGATIAIDPALAPAAIIQSAAIISHPVMVINFKPHEGVPETLDAAQITEMMPSAISPLHKAGILAFCRNAAYLGKLLLVLAVKKIFAAIGNFGIGVMFIRR